LQLLLLLAIVIVKTVSVTGLTCFSCTSNNTTPGCADPFDATGDGVGRCTSESHCVAVRMTGGMLCE